MTKQSITCFGFTLIELSIVLVIIGLLVGGVLAGKSLIHAAEIRSVLSEKEKFETAIKVFEVKYDCLPGDCSNATDIWGADTAWDIYYGYKAAANGLLTANGNGDGKIGDAFSNEYARYESYTAWQHLSNAGLIQSSLNGVNEITYTKFTPGSNVPSTKLGSTHGWFIGQINPQLPNGQLFAGIYGHTLSLQTRDSTNGQMIQGGPNSAFTPADQFSIDKKIDDGKPGTGILRGAPHSGNGYYCVKSSNNDATTAEYNAAGEFSGCTPIFIISSF